MVRSELGLGLSVPCRLRRLRCAHLIVVDRANRSRRRDRKSTRLNSSHTEIYTLSLHDALPIYGAVRTRARAERSLSTSAAAVRTPDCRRPCEPQPPKRSEEHTSELQSHRDLHSFPTRRSSDLWCGPNSGSG